MPEPEGENFVRRYYPDTKSRVFVCLSCACVTVCTFLRRLECFDEKARVCRKTYKDPTRKSRFCVGHYYTVESSFSTFHSRLAIAYDNHWPLAYHTVTDGIECFRTNLQISGYFSARCEQRAPLAALTIGSLDLYNNAVRIGRCVRTKVSSALLTIDTESRNLPKSPLSSPPCREATAWMR